MATHDIGDAVRLWVAFRDEANAQTAPDTVELYVRAPDGEVTLVANAAADGADETLAEAALGETLSGVTGVYKAVVVPDEAGTWRYRWEATGSVTERQAGWFDVRLDRVGSV